MDADEERDLERLYRETYGVLVAEIAALTGSVLVAEEAVQEAFIQLFPRWSAIRTYDSPRGWLRRVATHRAIDQLRKSTRERRLFTRLRKDAGTLTHEDHYPSQGGVMGALNHLEFHHRQVLILTASTQMTQHEVADFLGVPEGTVKSRLSRARAALSQALQEENRNV